jgi:tetratricopeptide (TPR) repeat protein
MKKAPALSSVPLPRVLQQAGEAWHRRDYPTYFDLMEQAARRAPGNYGIQLDLGLAYGTRYDYPTAQKCFEKAIRLAPHKSTALAMAGTHARNFNHFVLARQYFEQAAQQRDVTADTLVKLAEIHERFRSLDQAGELVERALRLDPHSAMALLVQARLHRLGGRLTEAETLLRPILQRTDAESWSTRIRGWYELGALLDRQGRYDEAMAAFMAAKEMIRPNAEPFYALQQQVHRQLKEAATGITPELLARWRTAAAVAQPPQRVALLCGHPRSGTTLLEQVLDAHPEVITAEETPVFFETYLELKRGLPESATLLQVLEAADASSLQQARSSYLRYMELALGDPPGPRLLIDKNPSLTALIPALIRLFPEMKFVVALRDPRDVCLSCFMQPLPLNPASSPFLTLERTAIEYAAVMDLWRQLAPRLQNPCLEIRYEAVVENLEAAARQVLSFLDLPWDGQVLHFDAHARQKLVRSPTYAEVTKPVFKGAVGRWRNYQKHLEPWLEPLEPLVKAFGY